jgi:UDP-N-acetylmuramate dehydrogenase
MINIKNSTMLEIKENELLKNHTTFRIGGSAKYFVVVKNVAELEEAINWAQDNKVSFRVIGGGSNLLVADSGYDGLIIKYFGGEIKIENEIIEVGAGVSLTRVMNLALAENLAGLEWAIGIPGTIGGAIHNNAGAYSGEMSQNVEMVKIWRNGKIVELENNDCKFGYRTSAFKQEGNNDIILQAVIKLQKIGAQEITEIKEKMQANLTDRLEKSAEGGNAGSTFQNIILSKEEITEFKVKFPELPERFVGYQKIPSAWLIEECGLKGKKIGGAMVSEKHAGKITNLGSATAEEVIMLISIVKQKVRSKYSLQLMEEVEYLGF